MANTTSTEAINEAALAVAEAAASIADNAQVTLDSASTAAADAASKLSDSASEAAATATNDPRARLIVAGVVIIVGIAIAAVVLKRRSGSNDERDAN